jgi:hypothetical protein
VISFKLRLLYSPGKELSVISGTVSLRTGVAAVAKKLHTEHVGGRWRGRREDNIKIDLR